MNVKMLETYQGVNDSGVHLYDEITVTVLEKDEPYRVSNTLGSWLVDNGKAEEIETPHYGGQNEMQPRQDDKIFEAQTGKKIGISEPLPEVTEENAPTEKAADPVMSTKNQPIGKSKRSRK